MLKFEDFLLDNFAFRIFVLPLGCYSLWAADLLKNYFLKSYYYFLVIRFCLSGPG